ncbi:hypothetical protein ABBQ32_010717 [Trebouxia sp. C0010 RCD-2024]
MPPTAALKATPRSGPGHMTSPATSSPAKDRNPTSETCQAGKLDNTASDVDSRSSTSGSSAGQLCGSRPDSAQAHQLLQTASARLLMVLTDDKMWKCFEPGDEAASEACSRLLAAVSYITAMPLALRTLVSNPPSSQTAPVAASLTNSHNQPQLAAQAQSAEQQKHAMVIQMTLHAVLRPLTAHVPASSASTSGRQLPAPARKQITQLPVLKTLLTALHRLASHSHQTKDAATLVGASQAGVQSDNANQSASNGVTLTPNGSKPIMVQLKNREAALLAVGNLAGMLAGEHVLKATQGNKLLHYLPKSQLLEEPGVAEQFLATASHLLEFAVSSSNHGAPDALNQGTFITQLLGGGGSSATAVAEVASFYHSLLEGLPQFSGAAQQGSSIVNALAFGCKIQQSLWRWCAMSMGLPLEAPREATRGWDVATLRAGMQGLDPDHAPKLGLFCRLYAHTLLVLDDNDFYERQDMFTLAQQRGVATALNALVFRTYCPASSGTARSSQSKLAQTRSSRMLYKWAPVLLRAMYERNVRRAYCPASLWLEPYYATSTTPGQQGAFSAAAVVRALQLPQSSSAISLYVPLSHCKLHALL